MPRKREEENEQILGNVDREFIKQYTACPQKIRQKIRKTHFFTETKKSEKL